ncbi:cohesin domain-containing protein [Acetivibrio clariflavus]|uniref:cohesin domain-containing protein n=1 Tax=Acetivibrio clariflavus TaxID=288965 RepID=UPI000481238D|nr:cohesin domain-containing protein [Acetivibrio clariflavus]
MKKFISGLIIGGILATSVSTFAEEVTSWKAELPTFKVFVRGEEFISENPPVVVEGRTYLPLRAMGDALGVPVEWNAELRQAEVAMTDKKPDSAQTKTPVQPAANTVTSWTAYKATFKVMVKGEEFISENPPIVVEGRTYLPLRALGDALGVPVEWNADLRQVEVDMKTTVTPTPQVTPTPTNTTKTVIGTIKAEPATTIDVPIKVSFDTTKGLNTFNLALTFDNDNLEFVEVKPGDIITDPDINFASHYSKEENLIRMLFLNETMQEDGVIRTEGVLATVRLKVKDNAKSSESELAIVGKATFADTKLSTLDIELSTGDVTVVK